jgi:hypothetical protein
LTVERAARYKGTHVRTPFGAGATPPVRRAPPAVSDGRVTSDPRPHLVVLDPEAPAPAPDVDEADVLQRRITAGDFDDHPSDLGRAIARRAYLKSALEGTAVRSQLSTGDRVVVRPTARPRYLHGERGTVQCWLGARVLVRLDRPVGRFIDRMLRCPPDALQKLRDG